MEKKRRPPSIAPTPTMIKGRSKLPVALMIQPATTTVNYTVVSTIRICSPVSVIYIILLIIIIIIIIGFVLLIYKQ